jgi:alpha-mannosidase
MDREAYLMEKTNKSQLTRRNFLKIGAGIVTGALLSQLENSLHWFDDRSFAAAAKRIYIANDDHTDYMWTADEATYRQAFLNMIDYYLDLADSTAGNQAEYQSRFNCDGSYWLWTYEKNKTSAQFDRLIGRIRDGHISVPLNPLVILYGGAPAEAVLRSMYYPGKIERRENLRFHLAVSMENQTLPYGLGALWAGAGARYSWKGICGCATHVSNSWDREHDIYWWQGPDGSRILMKWNSMLLGNASMGGYAEARDPFIIVDYVDTNPDFISRYPYSVIGAFGKGWDDLQTMTNEFVTAAQNKSNATRQVIVSNEEDFFRDFEATYGSSIPSVAASFGNEWELYCASMAEVSAGVKRSVEKLRTGEALATLVSLANPTFMDSRRDARDLAWMNLGLYWEHDWTADGPVSRQQRRDWQRRLESEIRAYVDTLTLDAATALGGLIQNTGSGIRFFVFNPLGWTRTDYADFAYSGPTPVHVIDLATGQEVPSQLVNFDNQMRLRILAENIPSVGYKVFEVHSGAGQNYSNAATVSGGIIENQFNRVTVSERGAITSWLDKTRGNREFVQVINGRAVNDLGTSNGTLQVENVGAVTVTLLASAPSPLAHTSRITFIRNSGRIEIRNDINQNFNSVYTWGFGFALSNPDLWHEEVGAVIRAKLTSNGGHYSPRNARYDWLTMNHYADMSGDGGVGVTLSNADCYYMRLGNSDAASLDTKTPQISPLVGGQVDGPGLGIPEQGGDTHFLQRFALNSHGVYNQTAAMKFALEHQNPLVAGQVTGGSVYPETIYSFVTINSPNVVLWALKPHDDGISAGIVVRLWNQSSSPAPFGLSLKQGPIADAFRLTHIETPLEAATVNCGSLSETLLGNQMKTYALHLGQLVSSPVTSPTDAAQGAQPPPAIPDSLLSQAQPLNTLQPNSSIPSGVEALETPAVAPTGTSGGSAGGDICVYLPLVKLER